MYVPNHFALNEEVALRFIKENGFGVLIASAEHGLDAVHLPIIVQNESPLTLAGHVARANPIWRTFDGTAGHLLIFSGPHAYISPIYYSNRPNVPTWNYVAVHARGKAKIVEDASLAVRLLQDLTSFYDPSLIESRPEGLTDEYVASRIGGIVAFEMVVDELIGKAKLSQNRSEEDQLRVKKALAESQDPSARTLGTWIDGDLP